MAGCATNETTSTTTTPSTTTSTPVTSTTSPPTTSNVHEATYVATQTTPGGENATTTYSFSGPSTLAAGWTTLHLQNLAAEPHQIALMSLGALSFDAFVASLGQADEMGDMHNMTATPQPAGGVGAVLPFATASAVVKLAEGEYAILCFIPNNMGVSHMMQGMVKPLTVLASSDAGPAEPVADVTLTLDDYSFSWSQNLTAGNHTVKVVNNGTHHHESPLFRLTGNATGADFMAAFAPGATAPPPVDFAAGAWTLVTGAHQYYTANFEPGHYVLVCFEQDSSDAPPHAAIGMIHEFDVV